MKPFVDRSSALSRRISFKDSMERGAGQVGGKTAGLFMGPRIRIGLRRASPRYGSRNPDSIEARGSKGSGDGPEDSASAGGGEGGFQLVDICCPGPAQDLVSASQARGP